MLRQIEGEDRRPPVVGRETRRVVAGVPKGRAVDGQSRRAKDVLSIAANDPVIRLGPTRREGGEQIHGEAVRVIARAAHEYVLAAGGNRVNPSGVPRAGGHFRPSPLGGAGAVERSIEANHLAVGREPKDAPRTLGLTDRRASGSHAGDRTLPDDSMVPVSAQDPDKDGVALVGDGQQPCLVYEVQIVALDLGERTVGPADLKLVRTIVIVVGVGDRDGPPGRRQTKHRCLQRQRDFRLGRACDIGDAQRRPESDEPVAAERLEKGARAGDEHERGSQNHRRRRAAKGSSPRPGE